jgi:sugar phosphate permease
MRNREMARMLKWIAMIVIGVGILCCIMNIAEFNDRNLGLMVGIGFLIGGSQIMLFGVIAPLMQRNQEPSQAAVSAEELV